MKPHHWPFVALGASAAAAITVVVVARTGSPALNMAIMVGIPLVVTYLAHLASKRAPGRVLFEFRVDPRPSWYNDAVEVTGRGLEITVMSGGGRMASRGPTKVSYGFTDLLGISTRQAVPGEAPWITLSDGRGLPVPAGDVVVLRTTSGEQVLPVEDPQEFVSLVRSRVSGLPEVHSTPTVHTGSHLDEVGDAPPPTGDRTTAVEGPAVSLTGPPLAVRWLVGATLALAGTVALPAVALLTTPGVPWIVLTAPGIAGVVWVLNRNVPRIWGRVALLAVPVAVFWLIGKGGYPWIPVLLVLCPVLGYLGGRMFRLGAHLGRAVEVRVPLRNGASLYVQRDRLVHMLNKSHDGGVHPQAMWLGDLTLVQPGTSPDLHGWPVPGGVEMTVGRSPMLRLVARPQQWILPVTQAGELAELIRSRQGTPARPSRMSVEEWRELHQWAVRRTTGSDRGNYQTVGIGWRLFAASVTGTFAWMFISLGLVAWGGILIAVPLTAWLLADWWRVRGRMRVAEHNVLPPGSPDWGETRPDHAPVPGWQPYR
ncbi:hypothetical protein SAMN05216188_10279 [Lentzea xinjiangensis]|uniref:Uncharacterized protein n=1 Tax=Lentzea xinjiangensis TaxID=402600 RepID=A0A1H9DAW9_9PSEU|nr:hypothetical protein [Lentzea xinjiangensis]SEQ10501.1 hypothetical protein SAMN05216188_10279 [Lentzea xinjiangensis]